MTPAKRNLFALAERLGVFVCDIQARMPLKEYNGWLSYFSEQAEGGANSDLPEKVADDEDLKRFFGQ